MPRPLPHRRASCHPWPALSRRPATRCADASAGACAGAPPTGRGRAPPHEHLGRTRRRTGRCCSRTVWRSSFAARARRLPPRALESRHRPLTAGERSDLVLHTPPVDRRRVEIGGCRRKSARRWSEYAAHASQSSTCAPCAPAPSSSASPGGRARARPPWPSASRSWAGRAGLTLIKLDSYYVDPPDLPLSEREKINYDHPDAFDFGFLNDHIAALCAGASVPVPIYDYVDYRRSGDPPAHPAPMVVVEGILVLWEVSLRERFDLKVYVDTDADLRLIRRMRRDAPARPHPGEHHRAVPHHRPPGARAVSSSRASATPT